MTDTEMVCLLLFGCIVAMVVLALLLAGVRDMLCNIDYDLSLRNMREYCEGKRYFYTTEDDD